MDATVKQALAKANNIERGLSCIVDRTTDGDVMNVLSCCAAIVCTSCYYTALAPSPKCPVCTKRLGDFCLFRGAKDVQKDVGDLVALLRRLATNGCRQPNQDAGQQTDTAPEIPKRSFSVSLDFLQSAFPRFCGLILADQHCELSGPDLKILRTIGIVAGRATISAVAEEHQSLVGLQLYRYLYTVKTGLRDFASVAKLLEKLDAPEPLVVQAALPDSVVKPTGLVHFKDTAFYASVWTAPFLLRAKNQTARALLDRFGLRSVNLPDEPKKSHVFHGSCIPKCWRCKVLAAVRNEIHHEELMQANALYKVKCTLCGEMVRFSGIGRHVRDSHQNVRTVICPQCGIPTSGPFPPKISHEAECPWRLFPTGPGDRASQYRRVPQPLRINGDTPPIYPDGEEVVHVDVCVVDKHQRRRIQFSWE